jgi:hypothetical protein
MRDETGMMEKILMTVKETAHALSMSPQTIYNRISRSGPGGFLKPRYNGSKPMFLRKEVEAFAESLPTTKSGGKGIRSTAMKYRQKDGSNAQSPVD